jgi:hypothetical protein
MLLGVHLHSMGVKRRSLSLLVLYRPIGILCTPFLDIYYFFFYDRKLENPQRQIKDIANTTALQIVIAWDNLDYSETVLHQRHRDPSRATTGKLGVSQNMSVGGLRKSMLHPDIALDENDISFAPGSLDDEILHQTQRYWIAEAIRYTHHDA